MKITIKDIVFEFIQKHNGIVEYKDLTKLVLKTNPTSKWQMSHWNWYKSQIVSINGKYFNDFSDSIKENLSNNKSEIKFQSKRSVHLIERKLQKEIPPFVFKNYSKTVEQELAIILGRVSHHIHPEIIKYITQKNEEYSTKFNTIAHPNLNRNNFLYKGSDTVFPGVRRPVNIEKKGLLKWKNNIFKPDGTIFDDNIYPRHIWTYLTLNKPYSSETWKKSELNTFELAHIFSHKIDEQTLEQKVFKKVKENRIPWGLFTSASNVVLIPTGLTKPTDKMESVKIAFYLRHLELYGNNLFGLNKIDKNKIPMWYNKIIWLDPELPPNWKMKIDRLLDYRETHLKNKYNSAEKSSA